MYKTRFCKSTPYGLCVDEKVPCPIDSVFITSKEGTDQPENQESLVSKPFGDYILYYTNDEKASATLTGIIIGTTPCLDPDHRL